MSKVTRPIKALGLLKALGAALLPGLAFAASSYGPELGGFDCPYPVVQFAGTWRADYDRWVDMLAGMNAGPGKALVAWNSAALYDMIYTQPVLDEFSNLSVPTVLMIGDKDATAIGKDVAPPEVQALLGHYPELARNAVRAIPHAQLVEFPGLGHAPMIQDPAAFQQALNSALRAAP